jgi:putative lipoic acid-binding regulatory protein
MNSISPTDTAPGLTFPAQHTLIAMGPPGEQFRLSVDLALTQAGARRTATPISHKLSRTGRYQSMHIEVDVASREELEALYAVLKSHPDVVYRL